MPFAPPHETLSPDVNRLAAAVRETGGGVFRVKNTFDIRCESEWSVVQDIATPAGRAKRKAAMTADTPGHALWAALDVRPEDEIVLKYRFSAFPPCASDLPDRLRARGFDTFQFALGRTYAGNVASVEKIGEPFNGIVRHVWTGQWAPAGGNWGHFSTPRTETLVTEIFHEFDDAKRTALLTKLHETMSEDALTI
jgi:hypothetical protein